MSERTRRRLARALIAIGALCVLLALPLAYLDRNVFSPDGFAGNAADAVQNDAVRSALAERATSEIVLLDPRAVSASPILTSGLEAFLASSAGRSLVRTAAMQTHNAFFSRDRGSIVVDLANLSIIAGELLRTRQPRLADTIDRNQHIIVPIADRSVATGLASTAQRVRWLAIALPIVALLCFAGAQWLTPGRRRAAGEIGIAVFLVGIAGLLLAIVGRSLILTSFDGDARDVAAGVLGAYTTSFTWWCLGVALAGAIVAASAASLNEGLDPADVPRMLWQRIRTPRRTLLGEVAGALALVAVGALVIADPAGALRLAATTLGAYFVFAGVVTLLRLIIGAPTVEEEPELDRRAAWRIAAPWAIGAAVVVLGTVGLFTVAITGREDTAAQPVASRGCNGAQALCDRTFDRVTFATSHNAMATAQDGFLNANHGLGFTRQLDRGVRGLLIDAYLGQRNRNGVVRTDLAPKAVEAAEAKLGADGLAAVQRLAGSVAFGPIEGRKQLYFCHIVCELGAIDGVAFLKEIRDWLDRNPNEVLSIMVEDAAPARDIMRGFDEAGLTEYASDFQWAPGRTFPTLGEMIGSGKRIWVAGEERGVPGTWYHRGYDVTQETPFSFTSPKQLDTRASCRDNRGKPDAPLFLINSWVETYPPNPKNADVVNRPKFLVDRARRCQEIRGLWPQLLAVDFVERGDVVGAAAQLNGQTP